MDELTDAYEGKVCVVTGAASGIGRAVALQLINAGGFVAISDIDEPGLKETLSLSTQSRSNRVRLDPLDVSDAQAVSEYAKRIGECFGPADFLFNIAGMTRYGSFEETDLDAHEQVIAVNYWGVVRLCKAFLPGLIERGGAIINVSSLFGLIGFPNQTHYCASKFAVRGFSETLDQELRHKGVSVSCVHPGGVDTGIIRNAVLDTDENSPDQHDEMARRFQRIARTTPERAATIILKGAARRKSRIVIGPDARLISIVQRLFPRSYRILIKWIARAGTQTMPTGMKGPTSR